jgi:hypothetical protein
MMNVGRELWIRRTMMKRTWQILMMVGLVLALTAASGLAQGRGWCGQGRGWGCQGGGGRGAGCWLTRVTPTDPKEKAFVEQVSKLQTEIRDEQAALATLQKSGASSTALDAQKSVLENLHTQFRELMTKNSELQQQIVKRYGGPGWCGGRGPGCWANCPLGAAAPACGVCPNCPWTK